MNRDEYLEMLKLHRANAYDNMEGEDLEGFKRWESVYCAYDLIIKDIEMEEGLPCSKV